MKRKLRLLHKYLSLTVAALWLMQAVTGALLVFHWELDDWAVAGPQRHLDPVRFGAFLENLQAAHSRQAVKSVYASGGLPGRFDVRSEERRVGKECRSRWAPYHSKKERRVRCR